MKPKPMIYVAGPYSSNHTNGVREALGAAEKIWADGGIPVVPHLTHFWDLMHPHGYEEWMDYDEALLARCDALVRIPGNSKGADREVQFAVDAGIPLFHGVLDCLCRMKNIVAPRCDDSTRQSAFQECFKRQCEWCDLGWPVDRWCGKAAARGWFHTNPEMDQDSSYLEVHDCEASHLRDLLKSGEKKSEPSGPASEASGVDPTSLGGLGLWPTLSSKAGRREPERTGR